ncbi:MAG: DUF523 domain-containing protein [Candidatus Omnitrophota bacterium]
MAKEGRIFLSACLTGVNCTYNGKNKLHPYFAQMCEQGEAIAACPEVLGGLQIPHSPSEIFNGDGQDVLEGEAKVLSREGRDVTENFLNGAQRIMELVKEHKIKKAVLKSKSPSCGCGLIYDGSFSDRLVPGDGVTAALLKMNGIEVVSDVEYLKSHV